MCYQIQWYGAHHRSLLLYRQGVLGGRGERNVLICCSSVSMVTPTSLLPQNCHAKTMAEMRCLNVKWITPEQSTHVISSRPPLSPRPFASIHGALDSLSQRAATYDLDLSESTFFWRIPHPLQVTLQLPLILSPSPGRSGLPWWYFPGIKKKYRFKLLKYIKKKPEMEGGVRGETHTGWINGIIYLETVIRCLFIFQSTTWLLSLVLSSPNN